VLEALQTKVGIGRIQAFLQEEEVDDHVSSMKRPQNSEPPRVGLGISHGTFQWNAVTQSNKTTSSSAPASTTQVIPLTNETSTSSDSQSVSSSSADRSKRTFQLEDINVSFPESQLSIITGPTGSGKTALLMALLGEMTCLPGGTFYLPKDTTHVDENGFTYSISFCAQTPWLQQQSIKDNILFGSPYDEVSVPNQIEYNVSKLCGKARYQQVLECCALDPDLAILEDGDLTEIGSRGVSLSGGQKARVALARAVYSRTKYVILDDVFAAGEYHSLPPKGDGFDI